MSNKDKWKRGLLSSGIALELEIMRFFNIKEEVYNIYPDYSYDRYFEGQIKEFSIDLLAEYVQRQEGRIHINLLIECKYRSKEKTWLFLPWLSKDEMILDEMMCRPVTCTDCFDIDYEDHIGQGSGEIFEFSRSFPLAFKALELHNYSGDVYEKGVNRGAYQLLYSIPNYTYQRFDDYYGDLIYEKTHSADGVVDIICPILVTNADMRILNKDVSIEVLDKATSLDEISEEVDMVSLSISKSHELKKYIDELNQRELTKQIDYLENQRSHSDEKERLKSQLFRLKTSINANGVLVCNLKSFEELVGMIENLAISISSSKKNRF